MIIYKLISKEYFGSTLFDEEKIFDGRIIDKKRELGDCICYDPKVDPYLFYWESDKMLLPISYAPGINSRTMFELVHWPKGESMSRM